MSGTTSSISKETTLYINNFLLKRQCYLLFNFLNTFLFTDIYLGTQYIPSGGNRSSHCTLLIIFRLYRLAKVVYSFFIHTASEEELNSRSNKARTARRDTPDSNRLILTQFSSSCDMLSLTVCVNQNSTCYNIFIVSNINMNKKREIQIIFSIFLIMCQTLACLSDEDNHKLFLMCSG